MFSTFNSTNGFTFSMTLCVLSLFFSLTPCAKWGHGQTFSHEGMSEDLSGSQATVFIYLQHSLQDLTTFKAQMLGQLASNLLPVTHSQFLHSSMQRLGFYSDIRL
jgi:hypothetical protein